MDSTLARRLAVLGIVCFSAACDSTDRTIAPPILGDPARVPALGASARESDPTVAEAASARPVATTTAGGRPPTRPSTGAPAALAWRPRTEELAMARDGSITLRLATAPERVTSLGRHPGADALVFSEDGKWLATRSKSALWLWNLEAAGEPRTIAVGPRPQHVVFSHDGRYLGASATDDSTEPRSHLGVFRTADGVRVSTLADSDFGYWELAFLPDNRQLATFDGTALAVWDTRSGRALFRRDYETGLTSPFALSADGVYAAIVGGQHVFGVGRILGPEMVTLDVATTEAEHMGVAAFSDPLTVVVRSANGRLASWSLPSHSPKTRWFPSYPDESGCMSSDGSLVVAARADGSARLVDAVTGRTRRPLEAPVATDYGARDAEFSPSLRFIAQSGLHPALWDLATGARTAL